LKKREIADRHRVALEEWVGTLAAPFESMPAANELRPVLKWRSNSTTGESLPSETEIVSMQNEPKGAKK
jgi:hypothetical protein